MLLRALMSPGLGRRCLLASFSLVCCVAAPSLTTAQTLAPAPTATVMPAAVRHHAADKSYERFFSIDYVPALQVYNQLSPGNVGTNLGIRSDTNQVRAVIEFSFMRVPLVAIGGFNQFSYPHTQNSNSPVDCQSHPSESACVEVIGGGGRTFIPAVTVTENDLEARVGVRIAPNHWYLAYGYLYHSARFEITPDILGYGFGIEKLPDLERHFSLSGSLYYYPNVANENTFVDPLGRTLPLSYRVVTYDVGGSWTLRKDFFVNVGLIGDRYFDRTNAPSDATHFGPRVGATIGF